MSWWFKGYLIVFSRDAQKDLDRLDLVISSRINEKISLLTQAPDNLDIKKLAGQLKTRYRLRCGDYRVIFDVCDEKIVITIIMVGHRSGVYYRLERVSNVKKNK